MNDMCTHILLNGHSRGHVLINDLCTHILVNGLSNGHVLINDFDHISHVL